jgi:FAD/FMN-containing dehydrogenase
MRRILTPSSPAEISAAIAEAASQGISVCPAGALHSMGGQQFATDGVSLSSAALNRAGHLDSRQGTVWVQSGATWPMLVQWLKCNQGDDAPALSIVQKQTGADELTLGGALSSNIHGRVLGRRPMVDDIESFYLTRADGSRVLCSRNENADLFRLAIGGYGMFGFVDVINLRLAPRRLHVRRVQELCLDDVIPALEEQRMAGATYGDFQYMTDEKSPDFMARGIMSVYLPEEGGRGMPEGQLGLSQEEWMRLYLLAHTDKARAYEEYAAHYRQTDGQLYWSDDLQFSPYLPEAGDALYRQLGWQTYASLMITELYVPRGRFVDFMTAARETVTKTGTNVVYGTVRLIEAEDETLLRWARDNYACIIFNLLVEHSPEGIARGKEQFQALTDCALERDGSFYLTYHRWARRDQVERAYPQFSRFLELKEQHDPNGVFGSDWYRHHRELFS